MGGGRGGRERERESSSRLFDVSTARYPSLSAGRDSKRDTRCRASPPPLSISYLPSPRLAASLAFYFRVWRRGRESARARVYSEGKRIPPNVGRESGRRGFYTLADGGDSPRAKMRLFSARSFRFPLTNKL